MGIWVRSYYVSDAINWVRWKNLSGQTLPFYIDEHWIACTWGTLAIGRDTEDRTTLRSDFSGWDYERSRPKHNLIVARSPGEPMNICLGQFQYLERSINWEQGRNSEHRLVLPLWLFLLFTIPPLLWVGRWRRNRGRGFPVELRATPAQASSQSAA